MVAAVTVPSERLCAQAPGPSPPAPLRTTLSWSERIPALSHDGSVGALYQGHVENSPTDKEPWLARIDLRAECGGEVISRTGLLTSQVGQLQPPSVPNRIDTRPAISASGAKLLYWVRDTGSTSVQFQAWLAGRSTALGPNLYWTDAGNHDFRRPRLQISREIRRGRRNGPTWCGVAPSFDTLARLPPNLSLGDSQVTETYDATISADGRVAAWTTKTDHCAPGNPDLTTRDLWLWYENGLAPPFGATCPSPDGSGTLARVDLDALNGGLPTEESFAVLAGDSSFVLVVSDGNLEPPFNPRRRPCLFEVPLSGSGPLATQLSLAPTSDEAVVGAALSGDGRIVEYALDRTPTSDYMGDVFLVRRDRGSETPGSDVSAVPAAEPFDLEIESCMAGSGTASMTLRLRQWRGGPRTLLITGEVVDQVNPTITLQLSPVVQTIDDEQVVDLSIDGPFTGGAPRCQARATDGASAHPDVVSAWGQP